MQAAEEDVRPVELSLLRAAIEVFRIRMFEIETDQVDAGGAEVIREEDRPISVREASEIPETSKGPGLCCRRGRGSLRSLPRRSLSPDPTQFRPDRSRGWQGGDPSQVRPKSPRPR